MGRSEENYENLIQKIDGFIRKYYLNKVVKGIIFMVSSFFAAYIILALAEYFGHFDPPLKSLLVFGFISLNVIVFLFYILVPLTAYFRLGKTLSHEQAALIIGTHFQPVKDKLLNTLQLRDLLTQYPEQQSLILAGIEQRAAELNPVPFASAIKIRENRKFLKYALFPIGSIMIVFFAAPSILTDTTGRLINYDKKYVRKAPFEFILMNKDLEIVQGEDLAIDLKLSGTEIPSDVYMEDGPNTFRLTKQNTVRFSHTIKNIQHSKRIRFSGSGFRSEEYFIRVLAKPTVLDFKAFLEYPDYLKQASATVENTGDLTVPYGTKIQWTVRTVHSQKLKFRIAEKTHLISPAGGGSFIISAMVKKDLRYSMQPYSNTAGPADSVSYQIRIIPDQSPGIEVAERIDSTNNQIRYFTGQINDDHGFSKLTFNYRILNSSDRSKNTFSRSISISKENTQNNFLYLWDIQSADVKPGEEIEYFFEVFDNDGVNGPKSTRTSVKTLRMATEGERQKMLERNSEMVREKMSDAIKKANQIEKEAKKLNQALLEKKVLTYEEKKQIENLLDKQKNLEQLIDDVQKENRLNQSLQRQNAPENEAILEKQKQIEELFNNVLDEKTRELLKNIERLLEQNNKNQTQDELSKMQMDNKSLQKELDRILELYKQLEFDQKLEQVIQKLDKLSEQQEDLSKKSSSRDESNEDLKRIQQELNNEFEQIAEELSELNEKNEALSQKNNYEDPDSERKEISAEQQKSLNQLDKNNRQQASKNQKSAADQLAQLSQKLRSAQQEGEQQEMQVNTRNLREILDNLLTSSFDQENVLQTLRTIKTNDPEYTRQTQKQWQIKDNLKLIEDSLSALSKNVPQIQSVVNKELQNINVNVSKAIENLAERRTPEANRNQQLAMTSINNLALMLSETLDQLNSAMKNSKPGSKGKGKPGLSQLSKMQEQLNKNMQKAREQLLQEGQQGQTKSGNRGLNEQLARMAREQQMIRQAIQELNRLENKDGQNNLGNLGELAKEMEQTEKDLVNKKIRQETISRQQDILSKLLDAERSEREREQDEKRESKEAKVLAPDYDIILKEFQKVKQQEIEILKTVPPGLNSFYKIKVGDYFKNLNSGYK